MDDESVRLRAHEISQGPEAGTPEENWRRAEREFTVAHDYDTVERDLEHLGMTLSRLPSEAGVEWRLTLPRGERVEAWEPGTNGLSPPAEVMRLIGGVVAGKPLVPGPPLSREPGAARLHELLEAQRIALLTHDPGVRLGHDPENLHQHRVAARRARASLRTTGKYLDAEWRRPLGAALRSLGEATGPVRDLDVVLEHLRDELERLDETEEAAKTAILERLEDERARARRGLLEALDSRDYRFLLARLRLPPRLGRGRRVGAARVARATGVPPAREARRPGGQATRRAVDPPAEDRPQACSLRRRARRAEGRRPEAIPGRCPHSPGAARRAPGRGRRRAAAAEGHGRRRANGSGVRRRPDRGAPASATAACAGTLACGLEAPAKERRASRLTSLPLAELSTAC